MLLLFLFAINRKINVSKEISEATWIIGNVNTLRRRFFTVDSDSPGI